MDLRQGIYTALLEAFVRLFASLSKGQPSSDELLKEILRKYMRKRGHTL